MTDVELPETPDPVKVVDHSPHIPEGGWMMTQVWQSECYCGFSCSDHLVESEAKMCMAAHRVHCEWTEHRQALIDMDMAFSPGKYPF